MFVDIGGIVDHHCLEVIICFVDIVGIVDHHCLEVNVLVVNIGGIVDHHCVNLFIIYIYIWDRYIVWLSLASRRLYNILYFL